MSLAEKNWTRVSLHKMALAYLRAERTRLKAVCVNSKLPEVLWSESLSKVLNQPNLDDPEQNRTRLLSCTYLEVQSYWKFRLIRNGGKSPILPIATLKNYMW